MGVLDTLATASAAVRDVTIIVDKALDAEWRRLAAEFDAATQRDLQAQSLAATEARAVAEQMEAIRDRVEAAQVTFTFNQLDWGKWLGIQADHPPRKDKVVDRLNGYDVTSFPPAAIRASCVAVTGHDDDREERAKDDAGNWVMDDEDWLPPETWAKLFASFNARQIQDLLGGARAVNDQGATVPPSARSLLGSQDTGASLAQPSPGPARRRSGGKGGSRRGSPTSSETTKG